MGNPQVEVEGSAQGWRLAIVGSREFSAWWKIPAAAGIIAHVLTTLPIAEVISGGAPGIDEMAEAGAVSAGLAFRAELPEVKSWDAAGGYRDRNERIAQCCTHLLSIRCSNARTYGSGWTADRAETLGRVVRRIRL
jgi:hypothetical protein